MLKIGLIREGKLPADNRVVLTPAQCKWMHKNAEDIEIIVQSSPTRCFSDKEYSVAGIPVSENVNDCNLMLGIKEVPVEQLIAAKTYMMFSHTKKKQPHNRRLLKTILDKKITLIDYECLEHEDGQRIIGFGFLAGIVGAHNGMMAYGNRTKAFQLGRVFKQRNLRDLIHTYFGLKLPKLKIVVTGSGRVAHGILEIMNLMDIHEVDPDEFLKKEYSYPVYTQLKGAELYVHKKDKKYSREHFHNHPLEYECKFLPYSKVADILLNGVYWDKQVPRLFAKEDLTQPWFHINTIADVADDPNGSVPVNLGDQTIEDPVYGVDRVTFEKTIPYLPGSIDVMAVGNLPNELPRDASRYFGEQFIKYILQDLVTGGSDIIDKATMVKHGHLTKQYEYLKEWAEGRD
jgi:alanine dehydrogenase